MFNYRYAFTTFTIAALLMLGYNWWFNIINHEEQVFVFREVLKILYETRDKEIRYLNLDRLRNKVKSFSFDIDSCDSKCFEAIVIKNGWKKHEITEYGSIINVKETFRLIYKYEADENIISCSVSYRGKDE